MAEGNSIRSTERLTSIHRDTILKLLEFAGRRCEKLLEDMIVDLDVDDVQADEIWGFVNRKEKRAKRPAEAMDPGEEPGRKGQTLPEADNQSGVTKEDSESPATSSLTGTPSSRRGRIEENDPELDPTESGLLGEEKVESLSRNDPKTRETAFQAYRAKHQLNVQQVARLARVDRSDLLKWRKGTLTPPSSEKIRRVSKLIFGDRAQPSET